MSFSDPVVLKVDGTNNINCPRVSTGQLASEYLSADGTLSASISTILTKKSRKRHQCRIDLSKITINPYDTSQNIEVGTSVYVVVDRPIAGFTSVELRKVVEGLKTFLTEGNIDKLLASEN